MIKYILSLLLVILVPAGFARILDVPSVDYTSIQSAIDAALTGDTVLVQPGQYLEAINYNGKNITIGSMFLTTRDTSYISQTIIDADKSSSDQGCGVLFVNGESANARLIGFTITGGYNSGGGGIQCAFYSSPTLEHLTITGNVAGNGGGIYCFGYSSPVINNVLIYGNAAIYKGGGICCEQYCSPSISNSVIRNNAANEDGGGLYFNDSSLAEITEVFILENSTSWAGAGIFCSNSSDILIKNSAVRNNESDDQGGGFYIEMSNPYLERITVTGNIAMYGGGIFCSQHAIPLMTNLTIANNQATEFVGDQYSGGGLYSWNSQPALVNSIVWDNSKPEIYLEADEGDSTRVAIAYSDVADGWENIFATTGSTVFWLDGNFSADPLFLDPLINDYRLQSLSPCRDAGVQGTQIIYNNEKDTLTVPALTYLDAAPDLGASETGLTFITSGYSDGPRGYRLEQNYPNPFNSSTTIRFNIPRSGDVTIEIYNLLGQKVTTLLDEYLSAGIHLVRLEASDLATGVYLYKIKAGSYVNSRKMLLLK